MKRLKESIIKEIVDLYQLGTSPSELSKRFNVANNSVTRILKKRGIARNQASAKVGKDDISKIIEKYNSNISSEMIAKEFNIDGSTVCRILKKNNISIRPPEDNKRKYKINTDFFENIDTEEKAYFLGMLYADGNISKDSNNISLTLHPKDRDVLKKLSNIIYDFTKIESYINDLGKEYQSVNIYSKKMKNDLINKGCIPVKSFKITFPAKEVVSENLINHFIRGYMDGDGCICLANKNKPVIDFTSTEEFLKGLSSYFKINLKLNCGKLYRRHPDKETNTRNIQICGFKKVKLLLDFVYKDATIFMDRKKQYNDIFINNFDSNQSKKKISICNAAKYSTTYIPDFNGNKITKEYLAVCSEKDKEDIIKFLFLYYRTNGFPYPSYSVNELLNEFDLLSTLKVSSIVADDDVLRMTNYTGSNISKHFHPHFFNVKSSSSIGTASMVDTFNDDYKLNKVIKNRVSQNYGMTGNMLRQGLTNSKVAFQASIFPPSIAKFIYMEYAKDNDIIYDYSMGFGHRLMAALSLPFKVKYIGVDPYNETIKGNKNIFKFFNDNGLNKNKEVDIIECGSENYCDPLLLNKVNVAFSSPPYFDLEIYNDLNNQAYSKGYDNFINNWWLNTCSNIDKLLKADGKFILNIKEKYKEYNLADDMVSIAKKFGFNVEKTYKLQLTRNLKFKNPNGSHKYEPIYVLSKL